MATASLITAQWLTLFYTVIGFGYSKSDHCPMITLFYTVIGFVYSKSDHCPMINSILHSDWFWLHRGLLMIGFGYSKSDHCPMINSILHSDWFSLQQVWPLPNDFSILHSEWFWLQQVWPPAQWLLYFTQWMVLATASLTTGPMINSILHNDWFWLRQFWPFPND